MLCYWFIVVEVRKRVFEYCEGIDLQRYWLAAATLYTNDTRIRKFLRLQILTLEHRKFNHRIKLIFHSIFESTEKGISEEQRICGEYPLNSELGFLGSVLQPVTFWRNLSMYKENRKNYKASKISFYPEKRFENSEHRQQWSR